MKGIAGGVIQLFAIIMITITFAVSITALSLWAESGATPNNSQPQVMSLGADVP